MERYIVHADQDSFFVSVMRLLNSKLNGIPVIIGGHSDRAVVASCSYEARAFGVYSSMPMRFARQLCPQAVIVRGDMDLFSRYSHQITEVITSMADVVEKPSIDEHYIDLTGYDKYYGAQQYAHKIREAVIQETGLPISLGLSPNKTVSKIATGLAKPNGELRVQHGTEKPFLAPLSIRKIPYIKDATRTSLIQMGVDRIGVVQEMPCELLGDTFGNEGVSLWQKANGIDNAPVEPYRVRKSISREQTFQQDTIDTHFLRKIIITMVDELAYELRSKGKVASVVEVKIRYSDFNTFTKQAKIPYTALDTELTTKALELFERLYSRRMLVRLIGVGCSGLVNGDYQINLFSDTAKSVSLCQAMDSIRNRFGDKAVLKAISL